MKPEPPQEAAESSDDEAEDEKHEDAPSVQAQSLDAESESLSNGLQTAQLDDAPSAPDARFDALVRERDNLRAEVTEIRKSLEEIQAKHQDELTATQERLEETTAEKEHAETQYSNLLGKVNTIRSQLQERLKTDAVCLEGLWQPLLDTNTCHRRN